MDAYNEPGSLAGATQIRLYWQIRRVTETSLICKGSVHTVLAECRLFVEVDWLVKVDCCVGGTVLL